MLDDALVSWLVWKKLAVVDRVSFAAVGTC